MTPAARDHEHGPGHDHDHDHPDFGPHGHGHEHDLVEPLAPRTRLPRLLVIAAVIAAVTLAISVARRDDAEAVARPPATTTPDGSPEDAVRAWLRAVADGDNTTASEHTGPASQRAIDDAGGDLAGFLTEAGEGYGAWATSPDLEVTTVDLGTADDGVARAVVVLAGTWSGEGDDGYRVDALPVARTADDPWRVEPWAFPQREGGRLEVVSPAPGVGGLPPDAVLQATAPGDGDFTFRLDDAAPVDVAGTPAGTDRTTARFDPPGDMTSRTHLATIAYVDADRGTFTATAFTFLVEG